MRCDISSFRPKFSRSVPRPSLINPQLKRTSSILDIFFQLWPMSLFIQMLHHSNQRVKLQKIKKDQNQRKKLQRQPQKPFLDSLSQLAESLVTPGQKKPAKRRPNLCRPFKRISMENVVGHLPVEGETRKKCVECLRKKIEKRTKTICSYCRLPYCKDCFKPRHR